MLAEASLPSHMWGEMLFTSVYLRNRSLVARLRLRGIQKTPYEVWYRKKPNLGHLRIVGCDAWHHVSKELHGQKKLSERAIECRLLGYEGRNQYRLWNPMARKVIVTRDVTVTFDESSSLHLSSKQMHWNDEDERGGTDLVDPKGGDLNIGVNMPALPSSPPPSMPILPAAKNAPDIENQHDLNAKIALNTDDQNDLVNDSNNDDPKHFDDLTSHQNDPQSPQGSDRENDDLGPLKRPDLTANATISDRPSKTSRPTQKALFNEFWGQKDN
jgi:hypothetical protein